MIRRRKCKRYETITIKDVSGGNYANEGYEGRKEGRRKEGRKEKGKKKSDRDEENKHDSREMLKVRMHSIPRIASLSAEQTRRRRKKRASVECKGRLKMLAPIQRGDFSYSDFVYMLNHHP